VSKIVTIKFPTHRIAIEAEYALGCAGRWTDINRHDQECSIVSFEVQNEEVDDYDK
jgi:hypothetical protein